MLAHVHQTFRLQGHKLGCLELRLWGLKQKPRRNLRRNLRVFVTLLARNVTGQDRKLSKRFVIIKEVYNIYYIIPFFSLRDFPI